MIIIKTHIYGRDGLMQSEITNIGNSEVDGTVWLDINTDGIKPNANLGYDTIRLSFNRDSAFESQYFGFKIHSFTNSEKRFGKNNLKLVGELSQISKTTITSAFELNEIKVDANKMFNAIETVSNKLNEIVEKEIKEWEELNANQNVIEMEESKL